MCSPRKFYLTQNEVTGDKPIAACAAGYHMASFWEVEVMDVSSLQYDTTLGLTTTDSGAGPPVSTYGWVRTGGLKIGTEGPNVGTNNCAAWTSGSSNDFGSAVMLYTYWITGGPTDPKRLRNAPAWYAYTNGAGGLPPACSIPQHVWCMQN